MKTQKIHPLLNEETQRKARQYEKENRLLGLAESLLSLVVLLVFFHTGFSSRLSSSLMGKSFLLTFLFYIAVLMACLTVFTLPLSFYSGYIHEHKWNFSNLTVKSWLWERFKTFLVGLALMWIVLYLLFWII